MMICRANRYVRFDASLSWLVDAECYVRIFSNHPVVTALPSLFIASYVNHAQSITAGMAADLTLINNREVQQIAGGSRLELLLTRGERGFTGRLLQTLEKAAWHAMRRIRLRQQPDKALADDVRSGLAS